MLIKRKQGWRIEFDRGAARKQAASDNPGEFTPVMVESPSGDRCTDNAFLNMGECGYTTPSDEIYRWAEAEIERFWESVN